MDFKKLQNWVEAINTYYAFALLVYAAALFVAGYIHLVLWAVAVATPLLAGWSGFLLKSYLEKRRQRYGFIIVSDVMSYEIGRHNHYTLRYKTTIKAAADHLMVYPLGYQWSGEGAEGIPKITASTQYLLAPVSATQLRTSPAPYKATTVANEGDWHYWFVAFNPPVHAGDAVHINYEQKFHDKKGAAKPYLFYYVRTAMQRLELNVKLPPRAKPYKVTASYIKPSDSNRPYATHGVEYDPDKQWATWVIPRPKRGYCYRIHWQ